MSTPESLAMRRSPGDCPSRAASSRQKVITFQWRSVSGASSTSSAIASATAGLHWELSSRNPSGLTSTWCPSYVRVVMACLLSGRWQGFRGMLAPHGHAGGDRQRPAGEQGVPVDRPEGQLPPVIEAALAEQRQRADPRDGEMPRQRLDVVVEIDQQRPAEAALDEAVGVAVEPLLQRFAADRAQQV